MRLPGFRDWSLSAKLTSLSAVTTAIALLLACIAFVAADRVSFRQALGRKLSTSAQIVASNSAAAILFEDAAGARTILRALEAEPSFVSAAIYDRGGRLFTRVGERDVPDALPSHVLQIGQDEELEFGRDRAFLVRRIVSDGETIGFVQLEARLGELSDRLFGYVSLALAVFGIAFLAALGMSRGLLRTITQPLLDLAAVARRVSAEKDYSVRADPGGSDETGLLILSFNQMLAQIEQREAALTTEIAERERAQAEVAAARDAAEQAREKEEAARRAAEQASHLKSAFLANMSHEIRTPLNVILGYNALIQSTLEESGDESQTPLIDGVARASKRLMTTVHGILDISRIESGAFDVHPAPIRLAPFIARLVEDHRVLAQSKGLELDFEIDGRGATNVVFDEYCLSHSITNLLDNAIKFTEKGGVRVALARDADDGVRISVTDTGIGMDPEYLPKLYEAFSQEQIGYTRKFEGSGLGLALTKRFLELHDATIQATSEKGKGTTFTIHIPADWVVAAVPESPAVIDESGLADAMPSPAAAPASTRAAAHGDPGDWAKPCVLVVEDDLETQAMMRAMLRDRYRVLTADDAREARRMLAFPGEKVRVVLMDLSLRGEEDGLSLTKALRADERWRTLPIVAVTAHALSEDRDNALAAGCDAYLPKPVERTRLLTVIQGFTA